MTNDGGVKTALDRSDIVSSQVDLGLQKMI